MGTQTFGSTSNPGSSHDVWFSSGSGVCFKAQGSDLTTSEEMYVDAIYVWASTHTGTRQMKHAIYGTGGTRLFQADTFHNFGTSAQWTHSEFSQANYAHLMSGQNIVGAVFCTTDLTLYGNGSGSGRDMKEHAGTFPNPWSTSNDVSSEGDMAWYLTYFPVAQVTSVPSDPQFPGASVTIVGLSFTAGVIAVKLNGVACTGVSVTDDTHLTCALPANATTGLVEVDTYAGNATSADPITISGGRIDVAGALTNTTGVRVNVGGVLTPVTRIRTAVLSGGVLVLEDAH